VRRRRGRRLPWPAPPAARGGRGAGAGSAAQVAQLQAQVKHLECLLPDQAAVMSNVGYHFTIIPLSS